jgi:hypothetical protein
MAEKKITMNSQKRFIINSFIKQLISFSLFFILSSIILNSTTAVNRISGDPQCRVTLSIKYDKYLPARPIYLFLKKENEWYDELGEIDKNRIRAYKNDRHIYRFYDLKSGSYWVGFSIKYLGKKKNKDDNWITSDFEYVQPAIVTGDYGPYARNNEVILRKGKSVHVELHLKIRFMKRLTPKNDLSGFFSFVNRGQTIPEKASKMLDENYFLLGLGVFQNVEKKITKKKDFYKITFIFDVSDDYLKDNRDKDISYEKK